MSTTDLDFYALDPATQAYILHNQPAMDPPTRQHPNFDNPPNGSAGVAVLFAICLTLTTVGFAARVYTRFFCTREKALVDLRDLETPGLFVPQYDVRLGDIIAFLKSFAVLPAILTGGKQDIFIVEQLNTVTLCLLKVAILLEWIRIFAPSRTGFVYWASQVTIWATIGFYVARLVAFNVACTPYALNWNKLLNGNCDRVNMYDMSIATCIFHIVSDMQTDWDCCSMILIIPQRAIWKLHMTTQKKLSVSIIFAIGLLAFISTVIRSAETVLIFSSTDVMHGYSVGACLGAAELTCGFLTITVPSIPEALSSIRSSKLPTTSRLSFRFGKTKRMIWSQAKKKKDNASRDGSFMEIPSSHAGSSYGMGNLESCRMIVDATKRQLITYERPLHGGLDVESGRV
ncbi:hypothetical protein PG988_016072 [Apiospora saccharicola]